MQAKTLQELAKLVNAKVIGDENIKITNVSTIEKASENDITFLSNPKYEAKIANTKAAAVLTANKIENCPCAMLIVDDPYYAFCQLLVEYYGHRKHTLKGISDKAQIDPSAKIGENCAIAANVVVSEDVSIGDNTIIYPGVFVGPGTTIGRSCIIHANTVIYEDCIIGNNVHIHSNTNIGQDGFGYAPHEGVHHKIPQVGRVIIEDDVEIGAGAAVERGTLEDTFIGRGTKIGDMVAVGHGATIGQGCILVPQCGIAGSAKIGNYVVIGGQAAVAGHLEVGNFVQIAARSGVINNIKDGSIVMGAPAIDASIARRALSSIKFLPDIKRDVERIKKQLKRESNND